MRQVTLALTHYNRFGFLVAGIEQVINDPRIGEVVISDDCSTDGSYEKLREHYRNTPKVRFHRNTRNLDCYRNKYEAVKAAAYPWVILFDSDNIIGRRYLDALEKIPVWDPRCFYCPTFAEPHFDYTAFSGLIVSKANVAAHMDEPRFTCALNTANYLVPRVGYLSAFDESLDPHTADSIYISYRWLRSGGMLVFVPGLRYYHTVHDGSHYKLNVHKTGAFASSVEKSLKALR